MLVEQVNWGRKLASRLETIFFWVLKHVIRLLSLSLYLNCDVVMYMLVGYLSNVIVVLGFYISDMELLYEKPLYTDI